MVAVRAAGRDARLRVRDRARLLRERAAARAGVDPGATSRRCSRSRTAFATYGIAVGLPPEGNGLIAVFVCAITLGIRRPDVRVAFEERAGDIVEIVKLGVFVVFGALLTLDGLFGDGWAAVAIVAVTLLVARPVAIWLALLGTRLPRRLARRSWPGSGPRAWRR